MLDRDLIESFLETGDAGSFREIVERHGSAVLRTCRRMLNDQHEAEDAFQATFLILVRRAPQLRDPELLGRWLVGVARRVAIRSRNRGVRQSARERQWASMQPTVEEQNWPLLEIRRAVREELDQLPSRYRRVLALCYLEGMTHDEAAAKLEQPVGTVKVQLVRARRLLKERLDRRGVALGVAFLLFLLRGEAEAAGSDQILADLTVEVMEMAAKHETLAVQAIAPRAFDLSRSFLGESFTTLKGFRFLIVLAVVGLTTGGVALATQVRKAQAAAAVSADKLSKVLDVNCR